MLRTDRSIHLIQMTAEILLNTLQKKLVIVILVQRDAIESPQLLGIAHQFRTQFKMKVFPQTIRCHARNIDQHVKEIDLIAYDGHFRQLNQILDRSSNEVTE